MASSIESRT
jgi:hypothetical protein